MASGVWYLRIEDFEKTDVGEYVYKGKIKNQIVDFQGQKAYFAPCYKQIVFINDKGIEIDVSGVGYYVQLPMIAEFPLIEADLSTGDDIAKYMNFYYRSSATLAGTPITIVMRIKFTKDSVIFYIYTGS